MFHPETPLDPVPVLTPLELAARLTPDDARRERERVFGTDEEYRRLLQGHDPAPPRPEKDVTELARQMARTDAHAARTGGAPDAR